RRAMEELSRTWKALDGLAETKRGEKIAAFTEAAERVATHGRYSWWYAVAATIAVVVAGAAWLRQGSEVQILATAVGQQRNVTLIDGSVVTLNTNTILETDLTRRIRQLYLRKGEAHFQVAHDRSRPFLVHAGDAVVRAVGTEFEVRLRTDQHVDVVVNEGRVEVQAPTAPQQAPDARGRAAGLTMVRALKAGEQLTTASADYAIVPVSQQQLSSELAWREGAIIFEGQPLSQAVSEIERYTDARIVVSDPRVAALRVGGRFRTDDVQGFLDGLQAALPVTIRRTADGLVYVDPRR
ncbi:MAG TPA: FecR domain-containing protein, partial [Mycobacterium sp.]|nr:FecR domain-containing protein [Mycobacterium sp.]